MDNYFIFYPNRKIEHAKFDMDFVKLVLPHVGTIDPKWKNFNIKDFNTHHHEAHSRLFHCLRNRFNSLRDAYEKEKAEKAKKKLEA